MRLKLGDSLTDVCWRRMYSRHSTKPRHSPLRRREPAIGNRYVSPGVGRLRISGSGLAQTRQTRMKADSRILDAHPVQLAHDLWQHGVGRGSAELDEQSLPQLGPGA
jgi:hypothetical protein